jgi:hypothetical protein
VATVQSAAIRFSCIAPSAFAGGMRPTGYVSLTDHSNLLCRQSRQPGGKKISREIPCSCWTKTLRSVRAWLVPVHWLTRCWRAFANQPPPCEFDRLVQMLMKGDGIYLYL